MNEDYISFETAKLAKEAEFNCPTDQLFRKSGKFTFCSGYFNEEDDFYSAPTQAVLLKWIRERFDLLVRMYFDEDTLKFNPCYSLINIKTGFQTGISAEKIEFNTFEEATEESLTRTLKFILGKNIHLK